MNTDQKQQQPDLHGASNTVLLLKEETHAIIGCAFEVLNELGHGLDEKCYENALVVEFRLKSIGFSQQRHFEVLYKRERVGLFIPDLIAFRAYPVACQNGGLRMSFMRVPLCWDRADSKVFAFGTQPDRHAMVPG